MLIIAVSFVFIAGLALAGFFFYVYWWLIQRPVPKLDGDRPMTCLNAPVAVLRDRHGIPHIYANSDADLFRVQGFVHAQDRLWQMEQSRRIAHGTLAEVFGEAALDADRFSRIVGFRRAAEMELAQLDEPERHVLEWYSQGVNEFMRQNPGKLAAEYNLLRFRPEPWTELDSVAYAKVMAWDLSVNWEAELVRLLLVGKLGAEKASELEPDYSLDSPVITEAVGNVEVSRLLSTAEMILGDYQRIKPWFRIKGDGRGSNSWVIAPKHSATRRAVLANDTHLGVQIPDPWYELHLSSSTFEVCGVSLPGVPGVVIGHNESIAWGFTNALCDVQDLYVERCNPDNPDQFEVDGEWYDAIILEEPIQVRGRDAPHIERVRLSRHGPIIDGIVQNEVLEQAQGLSFSLRWTGHEPGTMVRSLLSLNSAKNWETFTAALSDWAEPAQNMTYADSDGNIGYVLAGRIPIRDKGDGLIPAPGWDSSFDWAGYVPASELPRIYNPDSGRIVTANNKIAGHEYPVFLGADFFPGWRAGRLEDMLLEKERYTLRDMAEMQLDTGSRFARSLAPWFGQLEPEDSYEKVAAELLRKWDCQLEPDSSAATVFHYAWLSLLELVYGDKLGSAKSAFYGFSVAPLFLNQSFRLRSSAKLVELIEGQEESAWYADTAADRARNRHEILGEALSKAVAQLREDLGDNARRWEWGRVHQVKYNHPLGSVRLLRTFFNRGPFPVGGDSTTPLQTGELPALPPGLVQVIPSQRHVYDIGNWDKAQTVIATGQSGHPLSSHYDDQIDMWREGVYHAMPWSRAAVEASTKYRMTLWPEGAQSRQADGKSTA